VQDFVADLARAGKSFTEIKKKRGRRLRGPELDTELLSRQGVCQWACHLLLKKNVRTALFIAFAKMGAGMPEPGPGQHQERLGGGRRRLRRRLQKRGGTLQKRVRLGGSSINLKK
jgi:hypothetical protein